MSYYTLAMSTNIPYRSLLDKPITNDSIQSDYFFYYSGQF